MAKRICKCQKCKTYDARYTVEYDDPIRGEKVVLRLCEPCQRMMVNTIDRCQGLR